MLNNCFSRIAFAIACLTMAGAASAEERSPGSGERAMVVAQAPPAASNTRPPTAAKAAPAAKNCRREPIWGFRRSVFCKPTGMCSDREIKGYRTVCS